MHDRLQSRDVAALAFLVLGVFCLVKAITTIAQGAAYLAGGVWQSNPQGVLPQIAAVATLAIVPGWYLARCNRALGERFAEGAGSPDAAPATWAGDARAIAFSVLGVFFVVDAIRKILPGLGALAAYLFALLGSGGSEMDRYIPLFSVATGAQFAVGLWLFFGTRGLASLWHGLRGRGVRNAAAG